MASTPGAARRAPARRGGAAVMETVPIAGLMAQSGVGFGTSGARGLAHGDDRPGLLRLHPGFLQYLSGRGEVAGGDRWRSPATCAPTPRIMRACAGRSSTAASGR